MSFTSLSVLRKTEYGALHGEALGLIPSITLKSAVVARARNPNSWEVRAVSCEKFKVIWAVRNPKKPANSQKDKKIM